MKSKHLIWLLSGIVIWLLCHNLWIVYGASTYYFGTAAIIAVASYILYDIRAHFLTRFFLFLSLNNMADELFFDPEVFSTLEYLAFLAFFAWNTYTNRKQIATWWKSITS
jgi:hypothetical protein